MVIDDPYLMTVHLPNGFRIETGDGEGLQIASSQWIYRTTWRDVE